MRKRCNMYKKCTARICKHYHHHQFKSDCEDKCDRFGKDKIVPKCIDAKEHISRGIPNIATYERRVFCG